MFFATFGFALSLTTTACFLIFYSMSKKTYKLLEYLNYMGYLVMTFLFTFAFIGSELIGTNAYFPFLFLLVFFLILNLILAQYELGRWVSFWSSVAVLGVVYSYDFIFYSSPKEKDTYYIPMLIELMMVGAAYLLYIFQLPERWCRGVRFFQLYFTGFHFFTLMLINFYFEASYILYYTLKQNTGNYDPDTDNWYSVSNLFRKG